MIIPVNIKPIYYKVQGTKSSIMERITSYHCRTFGSSNGINYDGYVSWRDKEKRYVRVFNLIKHNRKVERYCNNSKCRIKPMYWEAFVYDIPIELLEITGCNVSQYNRNFKFTKRKN